MTAIIKNKFRLKTAKSFVENFEVPGVLGHAGLSEDQRRIIAEKLPNRNHYLFVGKPFGWGAETSETNTNSYDELNPPTPKDTQDDDARVWDEILSLKKIIRGDVSLVIPRSDWRPNTVYAQFDSNDVELYRRTPQTGNFYVLNKLLQLFICVSNANNSVSLNEPVQPPTTGPSSNVTGRFTLPDGYVWQYITSINSGDAVKFLTDKWIPIKTIPENSNSGNPQEDVQANAIPGELLRVDVDSTNSGSFTDTFQCKIQISSTDVVNNTTRVVFGPSSPTPSSTINAYIGYEASIVVSTTPSVKKKAKITSYVTSPVPTLILDRAFTDLSTAIEYSCTIQPLIEVQSDGTEIKLEPVVDVATKKLTGISIIDAGTHTSTVNLSINQPTLFVGNLPKLRPVLAPRLGLGHDPESDLGAFFAMVSVQLRYNEGDGDFPTSNDYRQVGILRDVKKLIKNTSNEDVVTLANEDTLSSVKVLNVRFQDSDKLGSGGIGFQPDQFVNIKNSSGNILGKARVVQFIRNPDVDALISGKLFVLQTNKTNYHQIQEGNTIEFPATTGAVTAVVFSPNPSSPAIKNEEYLKFHGDILYLENRRAILRAQDQIEDIKTIIEF